MTRGGVWLIEKKLLKHLSISTFDAMAEHEFPYDYFEEYVPVCDVVPSPAETEGNQKSFEETVMELSDPIGEVSSDSYSLTSQTGSVPPSRRISSASMSDSFTRQPTVYHGERYDAAVRALAASRSNSSTRQQVAPVGERFDVTVQFPKRPLGGEVVRVKCGRKVKTLVHYLLSIIRKTEAEDTKQHRSIKISLSEFVKRIIMRTVTGHLSAENFARALNSIVKVQVEDQHFITFLKASFPRLARRFLKGDVAIEPFVPLQALYSREVLRIPFDGHFLWGVYRSYYDRLVKNGEAPPISPYSSHTPTRANVFESDSESALAEGFASPETNSLFEMEPCRPFTGSILDNSFLDPAKVKELFWSKLGEYAQIADEAVLLVSEAARNYTEDVIIKVRDFAEHRMMPESPGIFSAFESPAHSPTAQESIKETDSCTGEEKEAEEADKTDAIGSESQGEDASEDLKQDAEKDETEDLKAEHTKAATVAPLSASREDNTGNDEMADPSQPSTSARAPIVHVTLRDLQVMFAAGNIRSRVAFKMAMGPNINATTGLSEQGIGTQ
ncbi:hypothetical protein RB195_021599 [Necator americanus]|uniref:Uncharacterized protein n=1 Tax=Necator americanus TaxID=51031 RepID=A0ABR1EBV1_NECAM